MMADTKALRAAELVRQYCAERGCSECVFEAPAGFCVLQAVKIPENWKPEELRQEVSVNG